MNSPPHNLAYEFGPYRLDCSKRILMRAGETISLALKAIEILTMLVAHAGELVQEGRRTGFVGFDGGDG